MPPFVLPVVLLVVLLVGLGIVAMLARYLRLWLQSYASSAGIGLFDLVAMSFKKVNPNVIVRSKIMAVQAGLGDSTGITRQALEEHSMAGGRVPLVVQALIAANPQACRTIFAEVFQDNAGTARVLTNAGFEYLGDAETFSVARGARVATWTYIRKLD